MQNFLLVLALIIAAIAAIAAWKAARATEKASFAQFIFKDTETYGSPEMLRAIKKLIKWQEQNPQDCAEKLGKLRYSDDPEVNEVDEARRKVSYYFRLPETLLKFKTIKEKIKDKLRDEDQVDLYLKFVKPLDDEVKKAAKR